MYFGTDYLNNKYTKQIKGLIISKISHPEKNPFSRDNAMFVSKAKINVFEIFSSEGVPEQKTEFQKPLILVFEVTLVPNCV